VADPSHPSYPIKLGELISRLIPESLGRYSMGILPHFNTSTIGSIREWTIFPSFLRVVLRIDARPAYQKFPENVVSGNRNREASHQGQSRALFGDPHISKIREPFLDR